MKKKTYTAWSGPTVTYPPWLPPSDSGELQVAPPSVERVRKTPVYDGEKLAIGNRIKGPAIVETADTTVVVHPGRTLTVDALGNFEITFK